MTRGASESRGWERHPSQPSHPPLAVPPPPCRPFVARAAAANVNPRTRLSYMTPFSGHDWCTRERCRNFPEFQADYSQNFATGSTISQDFPRKSDGAPTHSPTPPLKPGACSTEAPLKPRACSTETSCVFHWSLAMGNQLKSVAFPLLVCKRDFVTLGRRDSDEEPGTFSSVY